MTAMCNVTVNSGLLINKLQYFTASPIYAWPIPSVFMNLVIGETGRKEGHPK